MLLLNSLSKLVVLSETQYVLKRSLCRTCLWNMPKRSPTSSRCIRCVAVVFVVIDQTYYTCISSRYAALYTVCMYISHIYNSHTYHSHMYYSRMYHSQMYHSHTCYFQMYHSRMYHSGMFHSLMCHSCTTNIVCIMVDVNLDSSSPCSHPCYRECIQTCHNYWCCQAVVSECQLCLACISCTFCHSVLPCS